MKVPISRSSLMPITPIPPSLRSIYLLLVSPMKLEYQAMAGLSFPDTDYLQSTPSSNLGAVMVLGHQSTGSHSVLLPVRMVKQFLLGLTTGISKPISGIQRSVFLIFQTPSHKAFKFQHVNIIKREIYWQCQTIRTRLGPML